MHPPPQAPSGFAELGVELPWLKALSKIGFRAPTEIQRALIPPVLAGRDVIGQARTGTGKTAAFGLPVSQRVDPDRRLQAIVLVPTRELAVQAAAEIIRLNEFTRVRCVPVYGGERIRHQLHQLGRKPHIVVATPGRLMDLLDRRALSFDEIRFAVLDEVDRMLDIGFRDDIRRILSQIRTPHQTISVSATIEDEIKRLVSQYANDPLELNVSRDELTVDEVSQAYFSVEPWDKFRLLLALLKRDQPKLAIIFCRTKHGARKLAHRLHQAGIEAKEIHGDLVQQKRDRVMARFRKHQIRLLIATDLASRGIDVHAISHIINYDIPDDPDVYVHRIGRTARMGAFGRAYTFVTKEQGKQLTEIEKLI
ncbi:MAG: DEAD/DEAH box helicase, partial [Phycisphaerae bacterium]